MIYIFSRNSHAVSQDPRSGSHDVFFFVSACRQGRANLKVALPSGPITPAPAAAAAGKNASGEGGAKGGGGGGNRHANDKLETASNASSQVF